MKVNNVVIGKDRVTQVFLGAEEAEAKDIRKEIKGLKNENNRVVVFVGGQNEIMKSLKAMLQLVAVNS